MDKENTCGYFQSGDGSESDLLYNSSCIKLYENIVFHERPKHIDIKYHHLQDYVKRRIMML